MMSPREKLHLSPKKKNDERERKNTTTGFGGKLLCPKGGCIKKKRSCTSQSTGGADALSKGKGHQGGGPGGRGVEKYLPGGLACTDEFNNGKKEFSFRKGGPKGQKSIKR